ncbi:TPA: transcriptional repressor NrdR [Candidatus Woesearchaeota archaeon]|nr:Transcriptional repressor NrdR [archaeon GW2011_AR15]MBS3103890.1 transcriptional regulator NrdR [Candidatus Woesearchaeota archaeon]HIH41633.1 transcriptional repressor NrdR [Candidatus Woesearchaeota archaeon]
MKCPYCGSERSKVVDKRETEEGAATRRRRECLECEKRYTTYEKIETVILTVRKKSGEIQAFDRNKLKTGIMKACEKRPISAGQIDDIVSDIIFHLRNKESTEITSALIGRLVMTRLKKLDKVAYIRFASVYKDFKDPEEFQDVVSKVK